jgi:surfeit locus 1 family protein
MTQANPERGANPVFWAAVIAAFTVLIGLGSWQMQRRDWKLGLIERIEQRSHGEAISPTMARDLWQRSQDVEYYRVLLVGRFLHEHERHLYTIDQGKAGWRVITPLVTGGGDVVLVDRGYVPDELKDPAARAAGQIAETVELVGLARAPGVPGWFTPENDPARNRWFWRDVQGMVAGMPADQAGRAAPFMVEAEAEAVPGGWPRGGATRLVLSNRHLEYALTWYSLAFILAIMAFFFRRGRAQEQVRQL